MKQGVLTQRRFAFGVVLTATLAFVATSVAGLPWLADYGISPLIVGLGMGLVLGNAFGSAIGDVYRPGITFSASRILRFAIIFYGFRITFQEIAGIGAPGLLVSVIMLISTMVIGVLIGKRFLALDRDTSVLAASGSSICGAAAVVATESVLRSDNYKTAIAVATVVLFGTLSLFIYPLLYRLGFLDMDLSTLSIYIGATVHEVAQVVAIGNLIDAEVADKAVVVKLTRVFLLVPTLLVIALMIRSPSTETATKRSLHIPWFAVGFLAIVAVNSLHLIPQLAVSQIVTIDTFLLTMAMCALGIDTTVNKVKAAGWGPVYLGMVMFLWLSIGGYFITKAVVAFV